MLSFTQVSLRAQRGFTLVELISVLLLVAILGATAASRFISTDPYKLQESRDQVALAFRSAQQLAMTRSGAVTLSTSGNQVQILQSGTAVLLNGVQYPVELESGQTLSSSSFSFDRLGRTSAGSIVVSGGGESASLSVSSAGFIE